MSDKLTVVYSAEQVQQRVRELADQISKDYGDRTLHVVGILDNAFMFVADLVRELRCPVICHLVRAEMKDIIDEQGFERRRIEYSPELDTAGKDVLIVDTILQSGITHDFLIRRMQLQNPNSIRLLTFLDKSVDRKLELAADYRGFEVNEFVVGYGLPAGDLYRQLPYIAKPVK